ncbi:hypothetical protein B9G69_003080 [Bdellovibrio sp. SKB1291214]|uniref:hypothetical protein n=1 Tax=Bdellovibrio sp. SKB1291214 TaxID=1732569 RepID=UPI00223FCB50|nr:hypothetical protein [Bdellovibrio sp. SKB1291214]UYL09554.1 hypothetical protein B9G69_003080 [Bdellovibrio sp. SKB1291214]
MGATTPSTRQRRTRVEPREFEGVSQNGTFATDFVGDPFDVSAEIGHIRRTNSGLPAREENRFAK